MLKTLSAIAFSMFLALSYATVTHAAPVKIIDPPPSEADLNEKTDSMPGSFVYSLTFNNRCENAYNFAYSKAEVVCGLQASSNKITQKLLFSGCLSASQIYLLGTKACLEASVPSPSPISATASTPVSSTRPSFIPKPTVFPTPTPRPTTTPRPGCYFDVRVYQCIKAPCPSPATVEVCPTPMPSPIAIATPRPPVVTINTRVCQIKCNLISFNAAKRKSCSSKCGGK